MVPWLVDTCLHAVAVHAQERKQLTELAPTYAHANKAS